MSNLSKNDLLLNYNILECMRDIIFWNMDNKAHPASQKSVPQSKSFVGIKNYQLKRICNGLRNIILIMYNVVR